MYIKTLPLFHARKAAPELSKSLYTLLQLYETQAADYLTPYITSFIPFVLSLLPSTTIDYLRQAGIEFLTSTSEYVPSLMRDDTASLQHYDEFVAALLNMMSEMRNDETSEAEFWKGNVDDDEMDGSEVHVVAEDALNRVSLALGESICSALTRLE